MTIRLTRLNAQVPIVDKEGRPSLQFMQLWQTTMEALEEAFNGLEAAIGDITDNVTAIEAAQAAITAARKEDARTASYTIPSSVLSAADVGADATITIAAHARVYPGTDIPDVSVLAGSITGQAFSTLYYVYYDDPTLADDTPTFQSTTSVTTAQVGAAAGRHFVGEITTPANGGGGTTGTGGIPPSFGGPIS